MLIACKSLLKILEVTESSNNTLKWIIKSSKLILEFTPLFLNSTICAEEIGVSLHLEDSLNCLLKFDQVLKNTAIPIDNLCPNQIEQLLLIHSKLLQLEIIDAQNYKESKLVTKIKDAIILLKKLNNSKLRTIFFSSIISLILKFDKSTHMGHIDLILKAVYEDKELFLENHSGKFRVLFEKIIFYFSLTKNKLNANNVVEFYESLAKLPEDIFSEFLKFVAQIKLLKTHTESRIDQEKIIKQKFEYIMTKIQIQPYELIMLLEEFSQLIEPHHQRLVLSTYLSKIPPNDFRHYNGIDQLFIHLLNLWNRLFDIVSEPDSHLETELVSDIQTIIKYLLKEKGKNNHFIELSILQLCRLLTVKELYQLSDSVLSNLLVILNKHEKQDTLKQIYLIQIDNAFHLQNESLVKYFELYESMENEKNALVFLLSKLKTSLFLLYKQNTFSKENLCLFETCLSKTLNHPNISPSLALSILLDIFTFASHDLKVDGKSIFILQLSVIQENLERYLKLISSNKSKELTDIFKVFCYSLRDWKRTCPESELEKQLSSDQVSQITFLFELGLFILKCFFMVCQKHDTEMMVEQQSISDLVKEVNYIEQFYWSFT